MSGSKDWRRRLASMKGSNAIACHEYLRPQRGWGGGVVSEDGTGYGEDVGMGLAKGGGDGRLCVVVLRVVHVQLGQQLHMCAGQKL